MKTMLPAVLAALSLWPAAQAATLLNVSYDVSRSVYSALNPAFVADWKQKTGQVADVEQSHGGSSKQARAVIDGLQADVVTMNNPLDIDAIAKAGLLPADWPTRFPHHSSASWSTIVFVVRKGNPKGIHDWPDLVRPGVQVILPNPKTSGNGRYSYLAAWQYARTRPGAGDDEALAFERKLFANVPVLDTGGRGATITFVQRGVGDVLLNFESEAALFKVKFGQGDYEIVYPSLSVRADNPVAVVTRFAALHKTGELADAYLKFHFSHTAQEIFAANGLRPVDETVLAEHRQAFPPLKVFDVAQAFGGWPQAQATHFADGATFDQVIAQRGK